MMRLACTNEDLAADGLTIRDADRLGEIGDFDPLYLYRAHGTPIASAA